MYQQALARKRRAEALNRMREGINLRLIAIKIQRRVRSSDRHTLSRNFLKCQSSFFKKPECPCRNHRNPLNLESLADNPSATSVRRIETPSLTRTLRNLRAVQSPMSQHDIELELVVNLNKFVSLFWQLARARARAPTQEHLPGVRAAFDTT